jgi:hypothetical protein
VDLIGARGSAQTDPDGLFRRIVYIAAAHRAGEAA